MYGCLNAYKDMCKCVIYIYICESEYVYMYLSRGVVYACNDISGF